MSWRVSQCRHGAMLSAMAFQARARTHVATHALDSGQSPARRPIMQVLCCVRSARQAPHAGRHGGRGWHIERGFGFAGARGAAGCVGGVRRSKGASLAGVAVHPSLALLGSRPLNGRLLLLLLLLQRQRWHCRRRRLLRELRLALLRQRRHLEIAGPAALAVYLPHAQQRALKVAHPPRGVKERAGEARRLQAPPQVQPLGVVQAQLHGLQGAHMVGGLGLGWGVAEARRWCRQTSAQCSAAQL